MREIDIVYILRNDIVADELRYSLRSLENFPHGNVWFIGGCPRGFTPDRKMSFIQQGYSKWERVRNSLVKVFQNDDITEDFWLFNDDFYILEPIKDLDYMHALTLEERVNHIRRYKGYSSYARRLLETATTLRGHGYNTLDYALHVPMKINREKGMQTITEFNNPMFRSLYGNMHDVGGIYFKDVKISDTIRVPKEGQTLVSTSNSSFQGNIGRWLKDRFPEKSIYED